MTATLAGITLLLAAVSSSPAVASDTIPKELAPIGTEHSHLMQAFDVLVERATSPGATKADRLRLVSFLRNDLLPHAQREELILYPALDSVLDAEGYATATLILDHRAIAGLTLELADLLEGSRLAFERRAHAVEALVASHFEKEEQFVLPLLGRKLSPRELRSLLTRMERERLPS
jgi:hemerythrin-like domain-containing protein